MTRPWDQPRAERATFRAFAAAAGWPIRWQSVRSRPTPEPDLRCTIPGWGRIAFELVQIVGSRFAETTEQRQTLRRAFATAYATVPRRTRSRLERRLGGKPVLFVSFPAGTSPGTWRYAITPILTVLSRCADEVAHGQELPVWQTTELRHRLTDLEIRRGRRVSLHVVEMTEVHDPTRALLTRKFSRPYSATLPIELVACYLSQPPPRHAGWREEISVFIAGHLGESRFRRVWLFDNFTRSVPLVYPPPDPMTPPR
jgi:hypothetical protein